MRKDIDLDELKNDYLGGMKIIEIKKKHNICSKVLYKRLEVLGIKQDRRYDSWRYPNKKEILTMDEKKQIISDYENGKKPSEIIKERKIRMGLFRKVQKKLKPVIRYVKTYDYTYLDYEYMFKNGLSNDEIKEIVGCSYKAVQKRRKQYETGFFEKLKERQRARDTKWKNHQTFVVWHNIKSNKK